MMLDGVGIGGYRSFGDQQDLAPLAKINLIVGQNNAGKSNVLRLLYVHLRELSLAALASPATELNLDKLDEHDSSSKPFRFALGVHPDRVLTAFEGKLGIPWQRDALTEVVQSLRLDGDTAWFPFELVQRDQGSVLLPAPDSVADLAGRAPRAWQAIAEALSTQEIGSPSHGVTEALPRLAAPFLDVPDVAFIPAVRQIGTDEEAKGDLSGRDLIRRLASLQVPSIGEDQKRRDFANITEFVKSVLDAPDAVIEVPDRRDTIHVRLNGALRAIDSLGTGIHETVLLAVFATVHRDQIVCIEEPELHLHPLLQQKLLRYLAAKTTNQYFLTTHSAHLFGTPNSAAFHVRFADGQSTVHRATTDADRVRICADLGYRAADIVQANSIVWVEGPSDRLYLVRWLRHVAPDLIEGIHFSIMFYGGRLLAQLSASDEEISEFISLRRLNQYLAVVIDSDRSGPLEQINPTKQRVRSELSASPGLSWVTQGREIENYLPPEHVHRAVATLHPNAVSLASDDPYCDALRYHTAKDDEREVDKIKLARYVDGHSPDLSRLDLVERLADLVEFIRSANR